PARLPRPPSPSRPAAPPWGRWRSAPRPGYIRPAEARFGGDVMASLYDRIVLPRILSLACSTSPVMRQRAKIVPAATGRVLELGVGMGLNLSFYDAAKVTSVTGVDPSPELRERALAAPRDPGLAVDIQGGTAEALPFEDKSFDSVVCTFTLCSVCTPAAALAEARRVLKPGGRLLYCEH